MGFPTANPHTASGRSAVQLPSLASLTITKKIFLIVVEVRWHQSWVVFACRRLEWPEVRAIGLASLIEGHVLEIWQCLLDYIQEILEDRNVVCGLLRWGGPFHIGAEYDVSCILDRG